MPVNCFKSWLVCEALPLVLEISCIDSTCPVANHVVVILSQSVSFWPNVDSLVFHITITCSSPSDSPTQPLRAVENFSSLRPPFSPIIQALSLFSDRSPPNNALEAALIR